METVWDRIRHGWKHFLGFAVGCFFVGHPDPDWRIAVLGAVFMVTSVLSLEMEDRFARLEKRLAQLAQVN